MTSWQQAIPLAFLTACISGKPESTVGTTCPAWSGKNISTTDHFHPPYVDPYFRLDNPPFEHLELWTFVTTDDETGTVTTEFSHDDYSVWDEVQYDSVVSFTGQIDGYCDAGGYFETSRSTTWTLSDAFARYNVDASVTTSWSPPMLIVPATMEVGTTWIIDSEQTTTDGYGTTITSRIAERREVTKEWSTTTYGTGEDTLVRTVESSSGRQWTYSEKLGLVRGDGLTLISTLDDELGDD